MSGKIFKALRGLAAIAVMFPVNLVHGQDRPRFRAADEARSYLAENPTGPYARDAFRFLVGKKVAQKYREYPKDGRVPGRGRAIARGLGLSSAEVSASFDDVSRYY